MDDVMLTAIKKIILPSLTPSMDAGAVGGPGPIDRSGIIMKRPRIRLTPPSPPPVLVVTLKIRDSSRLFLFENPSSFPVEQARLNTKIKDLLDGIAEQDQAVC
jgi:hypothetical protein